MKIRTRLTLLFTLLVAVLTILSGAIAWFGIRNNLYESLFAEIKNKAEEVQKLILFLEKESEDKNIPLQIEDPNIFLYTLSETSGALFEGVFLQMSNNKNQIFAKSPNLRDTSLPILSNNHAYTLQLITKVKTVNILYYSVPIYIKGVQVSNLQIAMPMTKNEDLLNQLLIYQILEVILAVVISIFLGRFLSEKALRPVSFITESVESMEVKDFNERLDTSGLTGDEIGKLANTFNKLLERISDSVKSQNRFISDASHELRSPLTAIIGHAELLIKRGESNPSIIHRSSDVIIREAKRLVLLVNDMLFLARSEVKVIEKDEINLKVLILNIYYDLSPLHPQIELSLPEQDIYIYGNSDNIKQVFINLINNALVVIDKDTGYVKIALSRKGKVTHIVVSDNGSGIEHEHLKYLFDRFYRVDSSRERNKGGSGLGLSIVNEIIKNHNGTIEVKSEVNKGTEFIIELPIL
ncbi:MAG: HAMP domain-containing sensor histidine kinase [Candidatus Sericytochromatia bacterium]